MRKFIEGTDENGKEISIDPNDVVLNAAATNMSVATYPEKELDRGNKKPIYESYKKLKVLPADRQILEDIFKQEVIAREQAGKKQQEQFRKHRKTKKQAIKKIVEEK